MDSTVAKSSALTIETEAARIRGLLGQQKFAEALAAGEAVLSEAPDHRNVLLYVAIAQRYLGRVPDALRTLETLEQHQPRFSRLYEERGQCFVAMRQAPQAIQAFLRAVNINPALPASWRMLEGLYRMTGQADHSATAASHVATLANLPRDVVTATALFADDDLDAAESLIRAYLLQYGNDVEAMRLLARIGIARKVYDDAELLLAAVLELAPDYRVARQEHAGVLIELHRYQEARRQLEQLLTAEPDNRLYRTLHATAAVGLGEHERAIGTYRELLLGTAADADLHLSIAHAQKTLGRRQEAVESYRGQRPCGRALAMPIGVSPTSRPTGSPMRSWPGCGPRNRRLRPLLSTAVIFALRWARRWRIGAICGIVPLLPAGQCTQALREQVSRRNHRAQYAAADRGLHSASFLPAAAAMACRDPDPIFIVGLPRSGSTLLEQILASHSQVEGTQELANIQQIVANLRGRDSDPMHPRYPKNLAPMAGGEFQQLGERYIADTRIYRTGKSFFIDKMPNNFRHLGLIHLMLPNARIIDARREPMACCFSNLKQLFANGQEFTYSIDDIARYYRTYLELMRHWDCVLPGRVLRVHHEDVVEDLEGSVRRMLKYCGLEFEPQCIEFHKTERSVRTASSEQVRQPLFREGLDQWKNFEPWLEPLRTALGDALSRYRDH